MKLSSRMLLGFGILVVLLGITGGASLLLVKRIQVATDLAASLAKETVEMGDTMQRTEYKLSGDKNELGMRKAEFDKVMGKMVLESKSAQQMVRDEIIGARKNIWALMLTGIAAGVLCTWIIIRSVSGSLRGIAAELEKSAKSAACAAERASTAGNLIAEGTSDQVAALGEASALLEQVSSVARENADKSLKLNELMKQTSQAVDKAVSSMGRIDGSMEEILNSSEETFKIVRAIEGIAFQTNLLALNAAVEAARAGEAGAGFSIVAKEVRALAAKAAEAARATSDLIEETLKRVKSSSDMIGEAERAFCGVADKSKEVEALIEEIPKSSREQAQGILQLNRAVVGMKSVVRKNVVSVEQSLVASSEMSAQAERMDGFVTRLVALLKGRRKFRARHKEPEVIALPKEELPVLAVSSPAAVFSNEVKSAKAANEPRLALKEIALTTSRLLKGELS